MVKLTVSLSSVVRKRIDDRAAELGVSRSAFVESLVEADAKADLERELEEGYRARSRQNLDFAKRALPLMWEVIESDDSTW